MNKAAKIPQADMCFKVTAFGMEGQAIFKEISGSDTGMSNSFFCRGDSKSLPFAIYPGFGRNGCVILKEGYVTGSGLKRWIDECVGGGNPDVRRSDVVIELVDGDAQSLESSGYKSRYSWKLANAWVVKYTGSGLKDGSSKSEVGTLEMTYEEMLVHCI